MDVIARIQSYGAVAGGAIVKKKNYCAISKLAAYLIAGARKLADIIECKSVDRHSGQRPFISFPRGSQRTENFARQTIFSEVTYEN
jgi:hypothetical protein